VESASLIALSDDRVFINKLAGTGSNIRVVAAINFVAKNSIVLLSGF
jgi:hypothetical protein